MAPTDDDSGSSSSTAPLSGESNSSDAPPTSIDDSRVIQDVQAFREALQRGETPDRRTLIAKYPDIAKELSACLDGLEFVQGAAPRFQNGGPDSARGTPPDEAFPPHAQLGDYRIVREIGRGGMGVVYEAEQVSLARRVALKVLPFAAVMDARQIGRFKNEALAAAQLDHPHIVNVHAVGCERGVHYYAMRFVDGRPLSAVIDEHRQSAGAPAEEVAADTAAMAGQSTHVSPDGPAYFRQVAEIGRQVADALDHAHRHGVVHRDVKPSNLLLDGEGKAWVADFGLARMGPDANLTVTGDLVGTLRYMSPEQLRGERAIIDHRTDIYSLGLTLYELLAQRPAFASNDRQELLRQIATVDPPPPRRWNRALPVELETIVLKATAKEAVERYATGQEMADDLQRYLDDRPVLARRASLLNRTRKWARRHKAAVRTAVAVVLLGIMMAGASIGWVVRDRAAQRTEADRKEAARIAEANRTVDQALHAAALHRDHGDWPQAMATVEQTERLLARGAGDVHRQRVRDMKTDLLTVTRLEEVRLSRSDDLLPTVVFYRMRRAWVDSLYAEVFRDYGIDISVLDAATAADRIRASAIRTQLMAALDDWLWTRYCSFWLRRWGHQPPSVTQPGQRVSFDHQLRYDIREMQQYERLRNVADLLSANDWCRSIHDPAIQRDRRALEVLCNSPELATQPPSTILLLSRLLASVGAANRALDLLYGIQRRTPDDFFSNFELALVLSQISGVGRLDDLVSRRQESTTVINTSLDEAIGYMRAAVAIRPRSASLHRALGEMMAQAGQLDQAIGAYHKAIELQPDNPHAHKDLGLVLELDGDSEAAITAYTDALRSESFRNSSPDCWQRRAQCYAQSGEWNNAIVDWLQVVALKPDDVSAQVELANSYRNAGRLDKAIQLYRRIVGSRPKFADAHFQYGAALVGKEAWDEAIDEFTMATELDSMHFLARWNLANAYRRTGEWDLAISHYLQAICVNPTAPEPRRELAWTYAHVQQWDEAIAESREAIRLDSDLASSHNALAWRLITKPTPGRDELREALSAAERAVALNGESANYWNTLGVVRYRNGRWAEAIRALERSEELDPSRRQSVCNTFFLAMSRHQLGETDDADCWYDLGEQLLTQYQSEIGARKDTLDELNRFRGEAAELLGLVPTLSEPTAAIELSTWPPNRDTGTAELDMTRGYLNEGRRLLDRGKWAEAVEYYDDALEVLPTSVPLRQARLKGLTELGRWVELREDFEPLATDRRDDLELLCEYAAAVLAAGDRGAYQRLCAGVLERVDIWINARRAFLAARICAMGRDAVDDSSRTLKLAVKADQLESRRPYTLHTLALAQYRAGLWDDALGSVGASFEAEATWSGHICNWLLLALIHERMGHHDEARQWADKALDWRRQAYGEIPAGEFPSPGMHVHDRWGCLLLQREVDELLGAGSGEQQPAGIESIPPPYTTTEPEAEPGVPKN